MKINWFPGHMNKALKEMEQEVKNVDMIIYILDARALKSSLNPEFIRIIGTKPVLYVFNKCDLVLKEDITPFAQKLKTTNTDVLFLNSTQTGAIKQVEPIMLELCRDKIEKYRQKGIKTNLRAIVIGVPNSGKSTFINNLCGSKKTITGNKAGVTRGRQWLALKNGFEVCDTPGTLWPNLTDQNVAHNLAYIGSIKSEILDVNELSVDFLKFMVKNYPQNLKDKYELTNLNVEIFELIEQIAIYKHYLLKGNELDYDRTCQAILDDFKKGKFGKIILDK